MSLSIVRGKAILLAAGLAVTLSLGGLHVLDPALVAFIDFKVYDSYLRFAPRPSSTGQVVIVDLDEASLAQHGQWPWPRFRVAQLLEGVSALGPAAVGLDMVFAESDRTSPAQVERELTQSLERPVKLHGLPPDFRDYDARLARAIVSGPFVLGYSFLFGLGAVEPPGALPPPLRTAWLRPPGSGKARPVVFHASGLIGNLPLFTRAASSAGFLNAIPDADGVIRRAPLMVKYRGRSYPSLALAVIMRAFRAKQVIIKPVPGAETLLRVGPLTVPLGEKSTLLINYRGRRGSFPYISAGKILAGKVPPQAVRGKIVLVGTSAEGLKDIRPTPLDPALNGVEGQANLVDNILAGDILIRPAWAPGLELMMVLGGGLLATAALTWLGALAGLIVLALAGGGMIFGTYWALVSQGLVLSPLLALMTLPVNLGILSLLNYREAEKRKRFFRKAFTHYVDQAVVDRLASGTAGLSLEGEEKEVTILFADIRDFTGLSEGLSPKEVGDLLRHYFGPMARIITRYQGTIDKFIGDAIMAFWNAPLDTPDHQAVALGAALAMQAKLGEVNRDLAERFGLQVSVGMGLHCGTVRVGNLGSPEIFNYTVIGDVVNLASRLEALTKFYDLPILVSGSIKSAAEQDFVYQEVDQVRVRGKRRPVTVFRVYTHEEAAARARELDDYGQALTAYQTWDFGAAARIFSGLTREQPQCKLYEIYQTRCVTLHQFPPPRDWDLVHSHQDK